MRVLSISSAIAFVALNAFIALAFLLGSGGENQTSAEMHTSKLMALVGGALFVLATATLIGVVKERPVLAIGTFAAQLAFSVLALGYALGRSTHSDGRLMVIALGTELTGFAAIRLDFGPTIQWADHLRRPN